MFSQSYNRAIAGIDSALAYLFVNGLSRNMISTYRLPMEPTNCEVDIDHMRSSGPTSMQWRVQDHCAAVSRIYALFEQFCENLLADWIEFRAKGCLYNLLPDKIKEGYASGIVFVLGNISRVKYSHLVEGTLISEYNTALSGEIGYVLSAECLPHHKNNLRWDDLLEIFSRCGIPDLVSSVSRHPVLTSHFQTEKKIVEQTSSKLTSFIQYRNDAAHGLVEVEQILGFEELRDYADFIRCLCFVVDQLLKRHGLEHLEAQEKASFVGTVAEVFQNCRTVCVMDGVSISKNDTFIIVTERVCSERVVVSLMMDDVAQQRVVVSAPTEVGILFDAPVPKRAKLYKLAALPEPQSIVRNEDI
ncbi:MAE_28990/MAE_18760 family HEPN-like nuclease [Sphingomonas sp. RT2P30]|uniref:MAE_28990/MAE_18760 family HEPN-like nuclease n=1 Tax=Parasphingomonas halimpatiens TaxID=3096162 RepID=UPI002FC9649D